MDIEKLQALVIDALEDVKAQDIVLFDTTKLTSLFERIIVASGNSNRQTKALAASVRDKIKEAGGDVISIEGEDTGEWVLVDLGDLIVHIMQPPINTTVWKKSGEENRSIWKLQKNPLFQKKFPQKSRNTRGIILFGSTGKLNVFMQVTVIAVGHRMPDWIENGFREYAKRMRFSEWHFVLKELKPVERTGNRNAETVMTAEARKIQSAIPKGARIIALDEQGKRSVHRTTGRQYEKMVAGWTRSCFRYRRCRWSRLHAEKTGGLSCPAVFSDAAAWYGSHIADRAALPCFHYFAKPSLPPELNNHAFRRKYDLSGVQKSETSKIAEPDRRPVHDTGCSTTGSGSFRYGE